MLHSMSTRCRTTVAATYWVHPAEWTWGAGRASRRPIATAYGLSLRGPVMSHLCFAGIPSSTPPLAPVGILVSESKIIPKSKSWRIMCLIYPTIYCDLSESSRI